MNRFLIIVTLGLSVSLAQHALAQDTPVQETPVQNVVPRAAQIAGTIVDVSDTASNLQPNESGRAFWQWEFTRFDANHLRVQFLPTGFDNPEVSASLSLWDESGQLVKKLSSEDIADSKLQWSDGVEGNYLLMTLRVSNPQPNTKIEIKRVAIQNETSAALSIIGNNDNVDIVSFQDDALVWGLQSPIARLLLIQEDLPAWCTGFMISDTVMMTNHHCVRSQSECDDLKAQFNYHLSETGRISKVAQYSCSEFAPDFASEQLDYAFVKMKGEPGLEFGTLPLPIDQSINTSEFGGGDELMVIQHPAGEPKKIARINCTLGALPVDGIVPESDFSHTCDTLGGSSGSPVFDAEGSLLGLHHYGFAEGGAWSENRAVIMSKIIADLEAKNISPDALKTYASATETMTETEINSQQ